MDAGRDEKVRFLRKSILKGACGTVQNMATALFLSPIVPTRDSSSSTKFFEAMGFATKDYGDGYAICEKDGRSIHFQPMGEGVGEMAVYLEVDDVEALFTAVEPLLEGLKFKPPFDQPYGMREFHVVIPNTNCLLFVGQSLPA